MRWVCRCLCIPSVVAMDFSFQDIVTESDGKWRPQVHYPSVIKCSNGKQWTIPYHKWRIYKVCKSSINILNFPATFDSHVFLRDPILSSTGNEQTATTRSRERRSPSRRGARRSRRNLGPNILGEDGDWRCGTCEPHPVIIQRSHIQYIYILYVIYIYILRKGTR